MLHKQFYTSTLPGNWDMDIKQFLRIMISYVLMNIPFELQMKQERLREDLI